MITEGKQLSDGLCMIVKALVRKELNRQGFNGELGMGCGRCKRGRDSGN
jgi:hypothetical protein